MAFINLLSLMAAFLWTLFFILLWTLVRLNDGSYLLVFEHWGVPGWVEWYVEPVMLVILLGVTVLAIRNAVHALRS